MPGLVESKSDIVPAGLSISIVGDESLEPGDIVIVAVTGGGGTTISEPNMVGYSGGMFSTTSSKSQVMVVIADADATIPNPLWEYDTVSDLAILYLNYRSGFLNGITAREHVDVITFTTSPALQLDAKIAWVACGPSDGNSAWNMDEEQLFGWSPDPLDGDPILTLIRAAASPTYASGGPPIVSASIASASESGPDYADTDVYLNGGTPFVNLVLAIGIDSVNPETGTDAAQGWFVGTVGWDKAGWGS